MALIPRNSVFDLDKLFDDFWSPVPARHDVNAEGDFFAPRVDISEQNSDYRITAELPGVKKEDINLVLEQGVLTISAEKSKEKKQESDGKVIRRERMFGKFMRSFNLGGDVKEEDIDASFADGVLTLTIPKKETPVPTQKKIGIR